MRLNTRIGTTLGAGVLAAGGLVFAGGGTASADQCGYPPAQCQTYFRTTHFYPGQDVSFYTSSEFVKDEWVHGHVHCVNTSWSTRHYQANANGRVNGSFKIEKSTHPGQCTFTLRGNQGEVLSASFTVHRRP